MEDMHIWKCEDISTVKCEDNYYAKDQQPMPETIVDTKLEGKYIIVARGPQNSWSWHDFYYFQKAKLGLLK